MRAVAMAVILSLLLAPGAAFARGRHHRGSHVVKVKRRGKVIVHRYPRGKRHKSKRRW
jgi:hypothetical protein